jgi:hypothetical protein
MEELRPQQISSTALPSDFPVTTCRIPFTQRYCDKARMRAGEFVSLIRAVYLATSDRLHTEHHFTYLYKHYVFAVDMDQKFKMHPVHSCPC